MDNSSTEPRRYGQWAGNPRGLPEDQQRCVVEVWSAQRFTSRQCNRKRGYGEDGLYCKQHA